MSEFKGQVKFKELVRTDFPLVFSVIQNSATFQDGWKSLTNMPQHGNHNPNWKDYLLYLTAAIDYGLHLKHACPLLPLETGVKGRRDEFEGSRYWLHMQQFCTFYHLCIKSGMKKPKKYANAMYDLGLIGG